MSLLAKFQSWLEDCNKRALSRRPPRLERGIRIEFDVFDAYLEATECAKPFTIELSQKGRWAGAQLGQILPDSNDARFAKYRKYVFEYGLKVDGGKRVIPPAGIRQVRLIDSWERHIPWDNES